ncbi:SulP family inorganic anion transporter [Opitutaceae bacterium TAV3]|nr:SulP family inorganic anion transporter [Opitutaceae bacterium TAV3]
MASTIKNSLSRLSRWLPGLPDLLYYERAFWKKDLAAGLSVATVALPVGVAYAQLAGFPPVVGLYSTILPMVVYAFFGTSRQLILGPDAATCAMISATLLPLAAAGSDRYASLAVSLTLLTGVFCMLASRFRLGFLASFLSRPILTGLLNGVAISIMAGQLTKVCGMPDGGRGFIGQVVWFARHAGVINWSTLGVAGVTLGVYVASKVFWKNGPAALVAMVGATGVVAGATAAGFCWVQGVAVIGPVNAGLPRLHWPALPLDALGSLVPAAAGLALVSFCSSMLTGRSFAAKNGYDVDANREFLALGVADVASAVSQGFAISGADSRTAVNDAAGGQTRMVSLVGAGVMVLVLLCLTRPLAWLPVSALGMILLCASWGLLDLPSLWRLRGLDRGEFYIGATTLAGVLVIGVMPGILLAVSLALLRFLSRVARPTDQRLGRIAGRDGFYEIAHHGEARSVPGLLFYRFESPLIFFNADYFRERVMRLVEGEETPVKWVVIDAVSLSEVDLTGAFAIRTLVKELEVRGMVLAIAGRTAQARAWLQRNHVELASNMRLYPTRHMALAAYFLEYPEAKAAMEGTGNGTDVSG